MGDGEGSTEELDSMYRSPNVVRLIKSIKSRWADHMARIREDRRAFKVLTGKPAASLVLGSACLTSDREVTGSIPGTSTILNVD